MSVTLRLINNIEGCLHFQELERLVWSSPDEDIVPTHVLITIAKSGGCLLGAYADNGPAVSGGMIGATLWWLGTVDPLHVTCEETHTGTPASLRVYSHMAGVIPEWQGRGIGTLLKMEQRRLTLAQGLTERISWTYDPLYLPNSIFNLRRLGAVCNSYKPNLYGDMVDALNKGTPSDRCEVDWFLRSDRVEAAAAGHPFLRKWDETDLRVLPSVAPAVDGPFRRPVEIEAQLDAPHIAVPAPEDIGAIRQADTALSLAWRLYIRHIFEKAFANNYLLVDCVNLQDGGWYYILEDQRKN